FSRQRWEAGDVPFRVAVLQEKVLPLDVPQLPQALLQGFVARLPTKRLRTPGENPDAIAFLRLLRCGWPAQSHEQSAQRKANDACPHGLFSYPVRWNACRTPAVSRRAMDGTRRPHSCHWRGQLHCFVRPGPRVLCTFPRCAPHAYWMTSVAWKRTCEGIVRPRAFAVFKLMTSSNFIGCSIGKSPGLAPSSILST